MKKFSASSGFTLVEIAIVLVIVGLLLGSGIAALNGILDDVHLKTTLQREQGIARAIATYAQENYSIPCPANPAVNPPTGLATATCPTFAPGATSSIGIIPYTTLGLTQEQARDAYGNFITYSVSPGVAGLVPQATNDVHDACRLPNVWFNPVTGTNRNPRKARFCCYTASPATDVGVYNSSALDGISPTRTIAGMGNGDLAFVAPALSPLTYDTEGVAFVLVSHGKNAYGSFLVNGTNARLAAPAGITRPTESKNDDYNTTFISAPFSRNAADYFDDVTYWMTNDQLISAQGRDSCGRP